MIFQEEKRMMEESTLPQEVKYTNNNNPFNDPNLTSTFVWHKKLSAEGLDHLSMSEIIKMLFTFSIFKIFNF